MKTKGAEHLSLGLVGRKLVSIVEGFAPCAERYGLIDETTANGSSCRTSGDSADIQEKVPNPHANSVYNEILSHRRLLH